MIPMREQLLRFVDELRGGGVRISVAEIDRRDARGRGGRL